MTSLDLQPTMKRWLTTQFHETTWCAVGLWVLGALLLILAWRTVDFPRNWDRGVLIATTLASGLMGWAILWWSPRRTLAVALFDLLWVGVASFGVVVASANYLDRLDSEGSASARELVRQGYLQLGWKAGTLSARRCDDSGVTLRSEFRAALDELADFGDNPGRRARSTDSLRSLNAQNPCEQAMLDEIRPAIDRAAEMADVHAVPPPRKIPDWLRLFGPAIIALALGLRMAKAAFDVHRAFENKKDAAPNATPKCVCCKPPDQTLRPDAAALR